MYFDQSPYEDPEFLAWQRKLAAMPHLQPQVRPAEPTDEDGQFIRWIQLMNDTMFVQSVPENMKTIRRKITLLAEIDDVPVGVCIAVVGRYAPDYLFIQRVAVDPSVRGRGAGFSLLSTAAQQRPALDIAGATLEGDSAADALNRKLARSLGTTVQGVPRRRFARTDLGLGEYERHRPWAIHRSRLSATD